jgi:2-polyprenyl-3-methyl-5-hydroxy-6-metoxy-1,4-benzoquinol methylase
MSTLTQDQRRDALVGRALQSFQGVADVFAMYLGQRLGYYRSLWKEGPATPAELAARSGTNERYTREWLEQQAASGFLDVDDAGAAPEKRRFTLPDGHAAVLADADDLNYVAPLAPMFAAVGRKLDALVVAYRSGGGVSWAEFGDEMREAQGAQNKPLFLRALAQDCLAAIPDIHARLSADAPARVADIACGFGWSSIGIANAYPNVRVDGFDLDEPSISAAKANAREHGVGERVRFQATDAGAAELAGSYDLVIICEALHDMARPVDVLRTAQRLAGERGAVLVIDEKTDEAFRAPGSDLDRLFYGYSVLLCLPDGMSHQPSAATGTVMRPATLRGYAREAGFTDVETLPIELGFFRVYRLR